MYVNKIDRIMQVEKESICDFVCRGAVQQRQLIFFAVAARRNSDWIFGKFSFIFIEKIYNGWDSKEFSSLSARSFYLIQ